MNRWQTPLVVPTFVLTLSPIVAVAEDFWSVAFSTHYTMWDFVDAASIAQRRDGKYIAWTTSVVTGPGLAKYPYREAMKEELFDCREKRLAVIQDLTYDNDGALISVQRNSARSSFDVAPGSWGFEELSFVCGINAQRVINKNWIHIKTSPRIFSDNSYKNFSGHFCSSVKSDNCIVP